MSDRAEVTLEISILIFKVKLSLTRSISPGTRTDITVQPLSSDNRKCTLSAKRRSIMRNDLLPLSVTWIFFRSLSNLTLMFLSPSLSPTHSIAAS